MRAIASTRSITLRGGVSNQFVATFNQLQQGVPLDRIVNDFNEALSDLWRESAASRKDVEIRQNVAHSPANRKLKLCALIRRPSIGSRLEFDAFAAC